MWSLLLFLFITFSWAADPQIFEQRKNALVKSFQKRHGQDAALTFKPRPHGRRPAPEPVQPKSALTIVTLKEVHEAIRKLTGQNDFPFLLSVPLSIDLFRLSLRENPPAFPSDGLKMAVNMEKGELESFLFAEGNTTREKFFRFACDTLTPLGAGARPVECDREWDLDAVEALIERRVGRMMFIRTEYVEMFWSIALRLFHAPNGDDLKSINLLYRHGYFQLLEYMECSKPFTKDGVICSGGYGKVWATESEGHQYATKYIDLNNPNLDIDMISNEVDALRCLEGVGNVVQLKWAQLESPTEVSLTMERLEGMDGHDFALRFKKPTDIDFKILGAIFRELMNGLQEIHYEGLIHSDMKWENVHLGTDGRIVILDMGLAVEMGKDIHASTRCFAPPEYFFKGYPAAADFDVFQLGMMLFYFVTSISWEEKTFKGSVYQTVHQEMSDIIITAIDSKYDQFPCQDMENAGEFIELSMVDRVSINELYQRKFIKEAASKDALQSWLKDNIPRLMND